MVCRYVVLIHPILPIAKYSASIDISVVLDAFVYLVPCEFHSRYKFHSDSRIREFTQKSLLPIPLCACLRYENASTERVLKKPSARACFQSLKLHRNSEKGTEIHYNERACDSEMQIGRGSSI
ncbi:hypothetical protein CDAR_575531 [Caerostris darwini]|uniref:Uncharacterized protein n=1 Tax=Caerostris darwini TaxID=1538125 RepID=A0AAV4U3Q7_9ARAC|nr:hypothetical protein CDAR_575531 [Caerostris darwini]